MRNSNLKGIIGTLVCTMSLCAGVMAETPKRIDIPPGDLATALDSLSKKSDVELIFNPEQLRGVYTRGVNGAHSSQDAVRKLLEGTNFALRTDSATGAMMIGPSQSNPGSAVDGHSTDPTSKEAGKNSSQDFRVAQMDSGKTAQSSTIGGTSASSPESAARPVVEEIVVTAQKRTERLQDVPVPVTSINAEALVENNEPRLQDYYQSVPGLSVTPSVQSNQTLAIRGITTGGGTNPTVGVTMDDVPFGSSTNLGGGLVVPDLDPGELSRIEVLRGPQGTLYGASSMGGLLKFVTVDPSTDGWSGRAQAGAVGVLHGNGIGFNIRGSINAPISDSIALRASAFTREDPGYIDNPTYNLRGVNEAHVNGGRVAGLFKPFDDFSVKLTALYQDTRGNGPNDVDVQPGLGDLQQNYIPATGGYDRKVQAYSATVNGKLGSADLISLTGYNINSYHDSSDYTYAIGPLTALLFNGVSNTALHDDNRTKKFTEEVRLAMPLGRSVDWLLGGFYTHESSTYVEDVFGQDPATLGSLGEVLGITFPTRYSEYAGFTDITIHFTDTFDLQLGGRESHIQQTFDQTEYGDVVPSPIVTPEERSSANAFTYLVTPRLELSPALMIYGRFASGYRAGGTNATIPGEPTEYNPDKTQNYDLGIKGDFLDHQLSLDASLFYIDWKDIQLQLRDKSTALGFNANGGKAKSEGVEVSTQVRPVAGLTLAGWIVWNEAALTQGLPSNSTVEGSPGERLPLSSRFSGYLSIDQRIPIGSGLTADLGAEVSYVGDRYGVFTATSDRQRFPPYAKADLHAGLTWATWNTVLYANNVTDRRGVLNGGIGGFPPYAFTYIQPRAIGLTVAKEFQ